MQITESHEAPNEFVGGMLSAAFACPGGLLWNKTAKGQRPVQKNTGDCQKSFLQINKGHLKAGDDV